MRHPLTTSLCCALLGCAFALAASACSSSTTAAGDDGGSPPEGGSSKHDAGADASKKEDGGKADAKEDASKDAADKDVVVADAGHCPVDGDGGPGTFTCTGSLVVARNAPGGAVLQANGNVLIAGGWNNQTLTSSAEIYDAKTGTFTKTGSMHSPHYLAGHGSQWPALTGGKILAAGGLDATGKLLTAAELYDPTAGTFASTGPLGTAVVSYDPVTLQDGSPLFVGGYSAVMGTPLSAGSGFSFTGGTNQAQRYDTTSATFVQAGTLAEERLFGCNVVVPSSGDVLAIGGFAGASSTFESNIEQYDPTAMQWSTVGTLAPGVICSVSAFLLPGSDQVFLDGSYLLDPVALTTTPTTDPLPSSVVGGEFVQLANGDVLALPLSLNKQAQVYSVSTGLWTAVGDPGFADSRGFLLQSGEVLIVGGTDANGMSQSVGVIYHGPPPLT